METGSDIQIEKRGQVCEITINRPHVRNALGIPQMQSIRGAFEDATRDPDIRALTITGVGSAFCAGGDLKSIFTSHEPSAIRSLLDNYLRPMVHAMQRCDKPIVSVLNGKVAGAGIGLALAADIVIAADTADFVPAFGTIGAMPDTATLYFLAQNVGLNRAREIILLNQTLTAEEAARLGIYNRVVASDRLAEEASQVADRLAAGPTLANALAKKALRDAIRLPFDAFMDLESLSMAFLITTQDQSEGIQAFKERREPKFQGR